jgi:hypothetical protein
VLEVLSRWDGIETGITSNNRARLANTLFFFFFFFFFLVFFFFPRPFYLA